MPRKRTQPIPTMEPKPMPIRKLDDVPGPEAEPNELATHYIRVQKIMACHRYDDVIAACHWCCDMEAGLAYTKPEAARGTARMFCSGRCASAFGAHRAKVYGHPGKPSSAATDATPSTDEETATQAETPVAKRRSSTTKATPTEEPAEETGDEPAAAVAVPPESPSARKPKGQRAPKARKARAKKPERNDGMCAKGKHKMTEANRYEYKGTVWCRECRKASRAKSKK